MPDAGIATADIPPAQGLLAAGIPPPIPPSIPPAQSDQRYQAPADLKASLVSSSAAPEKMPSATNDGTLSVSARNRANNNLFNMKNVDGSYKSYPNPEASFDDAAAWLVRHQNKYGLKTVRQLIDDPIYGFSSSKDPGNLIDPKTGERKYLPEAAARRMGVDPDQPININDPAMRQRMVGALLAQEQGGADQNFNQEWGGRLAQESRENTNAELATIERDQARLMSEAEKAAPGTAERMQMLHEAHEASRRATALYEKQMSTPPIYQPTDVFAGFGGIVMALAALAGRRSAQPLTASLNAMAGAMDGMNASNKEQFDRQFAIWDRQTNYGLKLVDIQNQEIRSILEDQRLSDAEKQANLANIYRFFEMDREAAAARRGDVQVQWQHLEQSERMAQEARNHADLVKHWDDEKQEKELAGWHVVDDPTNLDENGNPTKYRYNDRSGKSTTLDLQPYSPGGFQKIGVKGPATGKPAQIEVKDKDGNVTQYAAHEKSPGHWVDAANNQPIDTSGGIKLLSGSTAQGGREATMIGRTLVAGADAAMDLKNIVELPKDAAIGWFGPRFPPTGPLDAAKKDLAQELTPDVSQAMDVHRVGLGRALAAMETGGVYINQELVNQYQSLIPNKGDAGWTVLRKLATMRQNAENSLEVTLANPRLSDSQKKEAEKFVKTIQEAVPWTVSDVTRLQFQGHPTDSLKSMAAKLGVGALPEGVPQGSKQVGTKDGHPIYQAPDGSHYGPQ